jgi:hypothetical protein
VKCAWIGRSASDSVHKRAGDVRQALLLQVLLE